MKQIAQEQKYILLIAPVGRGRNKRLPAGCDEGKAFPLIILLFYLYLEKILEYGLTGKTTLNVLNIADIGINSLVNRAIGNTAAPQVKASCGLLELHLDNSRGASFALGTSGTDLGIGTIASAARGFDALKTNFEINHYTKKNNLQNAAIALRTQYGFGGKTEKDQLKNILNGNTILKAGSGDGNAQTVTENGKRTVYLNGYSDNMTKEEQMKLGITLGHESYRDGVVSDSLTQLLETRNAVAGHTDIMAGMLADDMYKSMMSGIIAGDTNLQMDLLARSLGDEVFNDYVDGMYDSSADYWKVKLDGTIEKTEEKAFFREYIDKDGESCTEKIESSEYEGSDTLALIHAVGGIKNFLSLEKMKGTENYKVKGLSKNDSLGVTRNSETGKFTFFTAGLDFTREDNAFSVYKDEKGGYKDKTEVSYEDRNNTKTTFWMKDVFSGEDIHRETFANAFTSIDNVYHQNSIVSEYFNMRLIPYDPKTFGVNSVGLFSNASTAAGNQIGITGYDGKTKGRYLYHPTDQLGTMEGCFGPMSNSGVGGTDNNGKPVWNNPNVVGSGAYYFQQQLNLYHSLGIYNGYQFNIHLRGKVRP